MRSPWRIRLTRPTGLLFLAVLAFGQPAKVADQSLATPGCLAPCQIHRLEFVDQSTGFASYAGDARLILTRSTDAGRTWRPLSFPSEGDQLRSWHFHDRVSGWAIVENLEELYESARSRTAIVPQFAKMYWTETGGETWVAAPKLPLSTGFRGVWFWPGNTAGVAWGTGRLPRSARLKVTWDGARSWEDARISELSCDIRAADFSANGRGVLVCGDQALSTADRGASWTTERLPMEGVEEWVGPTAVAVSEDGTSWIRFSSGHLLVREAGADTWNMVPLASRDGPTVEGAPVWRPLALRNGRGGVMIGRRRRVFATGGPGSPWEELTQAEGASAVTCLRDRCWVAVEGRIVRVDFP